MSNTTDSTPEPPILAFITFDEDLASIPDPNDRGLADHGEIVDGAE